jgi:deoxycytidylate deaminase
MHQLLGADEVSGELWQLVNAIHDESDGLILCEWHSYSYYCTFFSCYFWFCCK